MTTPYDTQDSFISKARTKHGDCYVYNKTIYTQSKNKIIVTCKKHGDFSIKAGYHIFGQGCKKCGREIAATKIRSTIQSFLKKSRSIHNTKYNYCNVKYIDAKTKIEIICKEHGSFWMTPSHHITKKQGCPQCGFKSRANKQTYSTNEFICLAKKIHGGLYKYDLVKYITSNKKIKIRCQIHGEFLQTPNKHLIGQGCKKCSGTEKSNTKNFIIKSRLIHNNKYNYNLVDYTSAHKKVIITCKKHGQFSQAANEHLKGKGCLKCVSTISYMEQKWLDSLNIHERQITINIDNKTYRVDGYDSATDTIYEFYGDFWHGNPKRFNLSDTNHINKKTFGALYKETLKKEERLKKHGFKMVSIWEYDWKKINAIG